MSTDNNTTNSNVQESVPYVTIKDLMERLKDFPPDALVMALPYDDYADSFSSVEIRPEKESVYFQRNCFVFRELDGSLAYATQEEREDLLQDPESYPIVKENVDVLLLMRHIPEPKPFYRGVKKVT